MKILVIQLRRIGDVILTTPAVAALKARFPDGELHFLVEPPGAEALEGNPHIDKLHVYDGKTLRWLARVRAERYDWVVDFMGNPRTALLTFASGAEVKAGPAHVFHSWAYNRKLTQAARTLYGPSEKLQRLEQLGVPPVDPLPRLYLAKAAPENLIGLVPASRKATRRWPHYGALGRLLRRHGRILVFWGPGERELAERVAGEIGEGAEAAPETRTLRDAAALLARCKLVVTNCNGPKHMAVALGVPTVTVHGSSDPASWNPPHPRHVVVRRDELSCIGCGLNACPTKLECLEGLEPARVAAAAERLLAAHGAAA